MLIAIPSDAPGGMEAPLSGHFGHCDAFTLVNMEGEDVKDVKVVQNEGHVAGGCMAPVMKLKDLGVDALVAGGMGARPLAGFQQVGITVYFNEGAPTVSHAVELLGKGQARVFGPAQTCQGGEGNCGSHAH